MFLDLLNNFWRSTIFRLGLLFMALFSVSFFLLGWFVYWHTLSFMELELRSAIDQELGRASEFYSANGVDALTAEIAEELANDPTNFYLLLNEHCEPVAGDQDRLDDSWSLEELCQQALVQDGWLLFELDIPNGFRAEIPEWDDDVYARWSALSNNHSLIFGRMGGNIDSVREVMNYALRWGLGGMIALAVIGSFLMAGSVAGRLEKINRVSRDIRHGDLTRRMPQGRGKDEFDHLANNLNEMLDQIESLMNGVRSVSDSIAHDLRTPLTRLRGRLEQLKDPSQDDWHSMVEGSIEEADRMIATFNALLRIAEIEAGNRRKSLEVVNMKSLLQDITDLYEPLAAEKTINFQLRSTGHSNVKGDKDLLFQAISNLVDNAIKYVPEGGEIALVFEGGPNGSRLSVNDTGPGIPTEEKERVFERFYRLSEHRDSIGNGLGLSLVNAVAKFHQTKVLLEDNHPGLNVVWDLPHA